MSNVVALKRGSFVVIESARMLESPIVAEVGKWFHVVSYVDGSGGGFQDIDTVDRATARRRARELAAGFGCRVVDRSEKDPQA